MAFTWNNDYQDLEQVAEWLPAFTAIRDQITSAGGYPYNDDFKGKIPGIMGDREDTAIYLLQGLYRQREMQARLDAWLADGFRPVDSLPGIRKFAHVILYRHAEGTRTPDRSGQWSEYQDARLVPDTDPRQAELAGRISYLLPKGKRSRGTYLGFNSYAVLVKD
jgi:hypothetical protein